MLKKIVYIIILIFPSITNADDSYLFQWELPVNNRIEIVKTANILFLQNQKPKKQYEERNIIDLTCYERSNDLNKIKGEFSVYRKNLGETVFQLDEKYNSNFNIKANGEFIVSNEFLMPNLRNIPSFPETKVNPGNTWKSPAYLVLSNFSTPVMIQFDVHYVYEKKLEENGKKYAIIQYKYIINKTVDKKKFPADFPDRIYGKNDGYVKWDLNEQKPTVGNDSYEILFVFANKFRAIRSYGFKMNILTSHKIYKNFSNNDKEKAKEELKTKIPEKSGITVDTDKRGLVLRMGEILFDFDSYKLRSEAKETLDSAINAIKEKYGDREIIVEGHTDNIGNELYNDKLSEKRARSVAEYLKKNSEHDKVSYKGYGKKKPISDNSTKDGRQKNRRVEIIIKLN